MAIGMTADIQDLSDRSADANLVALPDLDINAGDPCRIIGVTNNRTAGLALKLQVSAHVIVVMVGVENEGQTPAKLIERGQDGSNDSRIDDGALFGLWITRQVNVVIPECGNLSDIQRQC